MGNLASQAAGGNGHAGNTYGGHRPCGGCVESGHGPKQMVGQRRLARGTGRPHILQFHPPLCSRVLARGIRVCPGWHLLGPCGTSPRRSSSPTARCNLPTGITRRAASGAMGRGAWRRGGWHSPTHVGVPMHCPASRPPHPSRYWALFSHGWHRTQQKWGMHLDSVSPPLSVKVCHRIHSSRLSSD